MSSLHGDRDLSGKSVPPPSGLRGPLARGLALAFLRIAPEVGLDREPLPWRGTSGSAHSQRGTHPLWVREAGTHAPPRSLTQAGLAPFGFGATKSLQPAVGRWGGSEGLEGPGGDSFLARGREQVRSQSGQKVPSSVGAMPSQALCTSPAPRVPTLCPVCYFISSARVEGTYYIDSSLEREMPVQGPGCPGPRDPDLTHFLLSPFLPAPSHLRNPRIPSGTHPTSRTLLSASSHHARFPQALRKLLQILLS